MGRCGASRRGVRHQLRGAPPAHLRHPRGGRQRPGRPGHAFRRELPRELRRRGDVVTDTKPSTRIVELPIRWIRDHMHEALAIYGLAMGYDSAVVAGRYGYPIQHTDRPGFRAVGAFSQTPEGEELVGFGYGYVVSPGQWWHDQVRAALDRRTAKKWLPDAFEVCELHVHPDHQSRGLGRRLLHALVADLPNQVA